MSDTSPPAERPRYLAFLPAFLFRADQPKLGYILKAWLLVLLPSIALSLVVNVSAPSAGGPDIQVSGPLMVAMIVLAAPLLETLIMAAALLALNRFLGFGPAVALSAIGWAIAHSSAAAIWGLVVWWPFLIFSITFLIWRKRGIVGALLIVTAVHALQNGFAVALLLIARAAGAVY